MISSLAHAVLVSGLDDWVSLLAIDGIARQLGVSTDEKIRRDRIVDAVEELVGAGLVEIGTVTAVGFNLWSGQPYEWVSRIRREAEESSGSYWEFAWWTNNTALGDVIAGHSTVISD